MIGRYHCSIINHCSIGQSKILCVWKIASAFRGTNVKVIIKLGGSIHFFLFCSKGANNEIDRIRIGALRAIYGEHESTIE